MWRPNGAGTPKMLHLHFLQELLGEVGTCQVPWQTLRLEVLLIWKATNEFMAWPAFKNEPRGTLPTQDDAMAEQFPQGVEVQWDQTTTSG